MILGSNSSSETTPSKQIKINTLTGLCFVSGPANLSEADAIIFRGDVRWGATKYSAGLRFTADTIMASRISYFQKSHGKFKLSYQATSVVYQKFLPIIAPMIQSFAVANMAGYLTHTVHLGEAKKDRWGLSFEDFLIHKLGFKLTHFGNETTDKSS